MAEALAVERIHGNRAPEHVYVRVRALAETGDMAGVKRWIEIGEWLHRLQRPDAPTN